MKIGIVGAGRIGGNLASLWAKQHHEVMLSYSRDPEHLEQAASAIGARAKAGTVREAVEFGDVILFSVPWSRIDEVIEEMGDLDGKVVIDTTNQFGPNGVEELPDGKTAAQINKERLRGAKYAKAFNTLTAGFQAAAAGRTGPDRVVMFYATDHDDAAGIAEELISATGFDPVRAGTLRRTDVGHQEPKGDVYGEEFHLPEARDRVAALRGTPPSGRGRP